MTVKPIISAKGIAKNFGGVKAIRKIDIELFPGEVNAVLGENGAGKSTLVNILAGNVRPDHGEIVVNGALTTIGNPRVARALGISVVHQHPILFPDLTVLENIMLAETPLKNKWGGIAWNRVKDRAISKMQSLDIALPLNALVKDLSSADQQMLEIVKSISEDTAALILDEPTSALSKREVASLLEVIAKAKDRGVAILFVGHRLDEIFALADRVTIMRDGNSIISGPIREFTPEIAVQHMVGKSIENLFPKQEVPLGKVLLEVKGLHRLGHYQDINFTVREGEIVGLAGLVGAGRTEIAQGIFGLFPFDSGEVSLGGQKISCDSPQSAIKHGIAYIPEDRTHEGVILEQDIRFNSSLAILPSISRFGLVPFKADAKIADKSIETFDIRTTGRKQLVSALSGGNQQKVVLGKWLATNPKLLILDDPTRGVDVGAKSEVYKIVSRMVEQGVGIILISNELEELLSIADRVITFYRGDQLDEFTQRPFDSKQILASMTGRVSHVI
jgi:rhamnose transport system ATP-binding protein